jgi:hypothetical protein
MKGITPAAMKALVEGNEENLIAAITPGGIERQEAEGQRQLVNAQLTRLPKEIANSGDRGRGKDTKEVYALTGIEVVGDYDDLFLGVKLPKGWKLVPTEYSMWWSTLVDEQGRARASVFYKAAFYDRQATLSFTTRFRACCEPEDAYRSNASFEDRMKMQIFGRVYDGDQVVFETGGFEPESDYIQLQKQEEWLHFQSVDWLRKKGYENFNDPFEYWDCTVGMSLPPGMPHS